jgi:pantetheine-phosphate adenylyltransferase
MKTIAVFPGTFNPFTIGHLNILEKAEGVFGKGNVIVAYGINPEKVSDVESYIKNVKSECERLTQKIGRDVVTYDGFLHNFVDSLENECDNVVVVRGLRNGDDLDYEVNQLRFISDFKPNIKTIFITCDAQYEHISSSAVRKLIQFGGIEAAQKYLV